MGSLRSQIDVSCRLLMMRVDKHVGERRTDGIVKNYRLKYVMLETLLLGNIRLKWMCYDDNSR